MTDPLSYCYLPDDYEGHRPANREEVHRAGRGAVYSWPSTTTIHLDLMKRTRTTVERATDDALADEAAHEGFADLTNPEITEPIHHRSGCSHSRTGKCICTYLAQWDNQRNDGGIPDPVTLEASKERLADFTKQMSDEGRIITIDTLNGRTSEWDGVFKAAEERANDAATRAKYWHKEYERLSGRFTGVLVFALAGWGLALARGIWGF